MTYFLWIKRFATVALIAFALITGAQVAKGHELDAAALHGALWSVITAAVFTAVRIYKSRRGQHCALCRDTPEMQERV
jgi:hypothetical protein